MSFKLAWGTATLMLLSVAGWAQTILGGQVRNGANQRPLPAANVFLAGTTKATITDSTGSFSLVNVPNGTYELVVSYVGFVTLKTTIRTQPPAVYRLLLEPDQVALPSVTVKARRQRGVRRASQLALFRDHFIGTSPQARQCRLLNPQVLLFEQDAQQLRVTAQEPLRIDNYALGYQIRLQLEAFTYEFASSLATYQGSLAFVPLSARSERQAQRWQRNRQRAYRGSMMHFGRALFAGQLAQEGFIPQRLLERRDTAGVISRVSLPGDSIRTVSMVGRPRQLQSLPVAAYGRFVDTLRSSRERLVLAFEDVLQVTYTQEAESAEYQRLLKPDYEVVFQTSRLRLLVGEVQVDANGHFWPATGLRSEGYWSWELLAHDLPFDYDPNESVHQPN